MNRLRVLLYLTLMALCLTTLNSCKPVVVDDTAYLFHAKHISEQPFHPYDFTIFWYDRPQEAMSLLLPPVLPYWLSFGIRLFGEHLILLKLWLLPFTWLLCVSVHQLVKQIAPEQGLRGTFLLLTAPVFLPLFNFMLDVPAVALGVGALALALKSMASSSSYKWLSSIGAGLFMALAMQTKYSMLPLPAVVLWYGATHRCISRAFGIVVFAGACFAAWEVQVLQQEGQSHFWVHLKSHSGVNSNSEASLATKLFHTLSEKFKPVLPLVCTLGGIAGSISLAAFASLHPSQWMNRIGFLSACSGLIGILTVAITDGPYQELLHNQEQKVILTLPLLIFGTTGISFCVVMAAVMLKLLLSMPKANPNQRSMTLFLVGWAAIEVLAYFVLTPFPAARRVIPLVVSCSFLALFALSQSKLILPWYALVYGCCITVGLWAVDCIDAAAEPQMMQTCLHYLNQEGKMDPEAKLWTQGHWGWQYYAQQSGVQLIVPGETAFQAGDLLIIPVEPSPGAFFRPHHGDAKFRWEADKLQILTTLKSEDWLPSATVPALYSGPFPIIGKHHPALSVQIVRVTIGHMAQSAD